MRKTYTAAMDCNLQILFRDLYTIDGMGGDDEGDLRIVSPVAPE
jgi:hypothetical protein